MACLMITADDASGWGGGSQVVRQEYQALQTLGQCEIWDRQRLCSPPQYLGVDDSEEPWNCDNWCAYNLCTIGFDKAQLAHFYSGTWGKTVADLKEFSVLVSMTIAAHDKEISQHEHQKLGIPFSYPHLVESNLWRRYIEGYRLADVIVSPSTVAARTIRGYGSEFECKRIEVIPHGCELPTQVKPLPSRFIVGYMGSIGVDKGLIYLLQAWKNLNYKDAILRIAGKDSLQLRPWVEQFGGGSIHLAGWQDNVSSFYDGISCYIQPSATEGFGMEVTEAMAHNRPVICSDGAGAVDMVQDGINGRRVPACNVDELASAIDNMRRHDDMAAMGAEGRKIAEKNTWEIVRGRYVDLWRGML